MGIRASAFAAGLEDRYEIEIAHRSSDKIKSIFDFFKTLRRTRPAITYVVDMAFSGVIAGLFYRAAHWNNRLVIDTGDSIYALARSVGNRGRLGMWMTWLLEFTALRFADWIIVRGTIHKRQLARRGLKVEVIQDGFERELFRPMKVDELRRQLQLDGVTTIGFVGSLIWSPQLQMCYGWELIEVISILRDMPVKAVVIGDGSGLDILRQHARKRGIEDRFCFLGRVPYAELAQYINLIDICLSTQTNDTAGQVRTTGKLPLYLACGRYVLASRVGEAGLLLAEEMLVDYEGTRDLNYPQRLTQKILTVLKAPERLLQRESLRDLAERHFDYAVLVRRLAGVLDCAEMRS